jgi:hypothetical protein
MMRTTVLRKSASLVAVGVLGVTGAVCSVSPANAGPPIYRAPCTSTSLQLISNQTTCWAGYEGSIYVKLYNVTRIRSGEHMGYVVGDDGRIEPFPYTLSDFRIPKMTVVRIVFTSP